MTPSFRNPLWPQHPRCWAGNKRVPLGECIPPAKLHTLVGAGMMVPDEALPAPISQPKTMTPSSTHNRSLTLSGHSSDHIYPTPFLFLSASPNSYPASECYSALLCGPLFLSPAPSNDLVPAPSAVSETHGPRRSRAFPYLNGVDFIILLHLVCTRVYLNLKKGSGLGKNLMASLPIHNAGR